MTVNKERLQLGLDALRSGEFEQCTGALRQVLLGKAQYCCLGVLTEVAIRNGLVIEDYCTLCEVPFDSDGCDHAESEDADGSLISSDVWELNTGTLSQPVRNWYGFEEEDPYIGYNSEDPEEGYKDPTPDVSATIANDDQHWDFERIADGFEAVCMPKEELNHERG
jgi:hypothetical protein